MEETNAYWEGVAADLDPEELAKVEAEIAALDSRPRVDPENG